MVHLNTQRSLGMTILLSIVTFGIYPLFLIHYIARDVNLSCAGDGKQTNGLIMLCLLSVVTFGIYSYVWFYGVADRMRNAGAQIDGGNVILWQIFGCLIIIGPFVALSKVLNALNYVNGVYNTKQGLVNLNQSAAN